MNYMTSKNIGIALFVLFLIALAVFLMQPKGALAPETSEENATTTATSTATTTTTSIATTTENGSVEATTSTETSTSTPKKKSQLQFSMENVPLVKKDLGPRQPATVSPLAALKYAAEAMQAGDNERALSYFAPTVRESYRTSFNVDYKGKIHPVFAAYLNGRTDAVELIEPDSGLYEIAVYPSKQGGTPFRANFMFSGSVNEFVIFEL